MYKSKYKVIEGLPLTETLPLLLEWKGLSPERVQEETNGRIKQVNIHRICAGETISPGRNVVTGIAEFFGLTFPQIYDVSYVRDFVSQSSLPRPTPNTTPGAPLSLPNLLTHLRPQIEKLSPELREVVGQMLLAYARDPAQEEKLADALQKLVPDD